jgi:hypothetical protein
MALLIEPSIGRSGRIEPATPRPERGVTPLAEARSGPNLILAVARETASRASPVIPR